MQTHRVCHHRAQRHEDMIDMMTDLESEIWKPDGMSTGHVDESTSLWHFGRCPLRSALERGGPQEKTWRNVRKLTSKVGRGVAGWIPGWICWMSFLRNQRDKKKSLKVLPCWQRFHPGLLFISSNFRLFGFLN